MADHKALDRAVEPLGSPTEALRSAVFRAFHRGHDPATALQDAAGRLERLTLDTMVGSYLYGQRAAFRSVVRHDVTSRRRHLSTLDAARTLAKKTYELSPHDERNIRDAMGPRATDAIDSVISPASIKIQAAMREIIEGNMHVKEGIEVLSGALDKAGLGIQPYAVKRMVRDELSTTYMAGRMQFLEDPDVAQDIWGYQYVTVGDDRVRLEHRILDGVRLKKGDPFGRGTRPPMGSSVGAISWNYSTTWSRKSCRRPPLRSERLRMAA
jgi:hypothetical protein